MVDSQTTAPSPQRKRFWFEPIACTVVGLVANIILAVGKILIGLLARSAALIADGFHSLGDVLSDIGILLTLKAAARPPDKNHPYGHHSFETLGAILVAGFMLLTAGYIGKEAIEILRTREFATPEMPALVASLASVIIKEALARYTLLAGRLHGSPALLANGAMHRSDAISSLAAAVGIGGAMLGWPILDSVAALVIALLILKMGFDLMRESIMVLLDTMPDAELVDGLRRSAGSVPCIQEVVDLHVRQRGSYYLADLRIAVHPDHTIGSAHNIAHEAERKIVADFPKVSRVFVHVEPGGRDLPFGCPTCGPDGCQVQPNTSSDAPSAES